MNRNISEQINSIIVLLYKMNDGMHVVLTMTSLSLLLTYYRYCDAI